MAFRGTLFDESCAEVAFKTWRIDMFICGGSLSQGGQIRHSERALIWQLSVAATLRFWS